MKILIIQTAFIGDVILATPLIESLKESNSSTQIDFLLRKGNEFLLDNNPHINEILIWHKKKPKQKELPRLIKLIRKNKYDLVINLQRFFSSGLFTALSGANEKRGFNKNPLSFSFSKSFSHFIEEGIHEVDRNLSLLEGLASTQRRLPKLYPAVSDYEKISVYQTEEYVCIAPTSVWYTKQLPERKWIDLIDKLSVNKIYLVGSNYDRITCEKLKDHCEKRIINLAGKLTLIQSAALFEKAKMNYVNDSAPLHLASAMNAPVTVFFCSTVPQFGFGPLSSNAKIVQIGSPLECRPCGLAGKKSCPKGHFKCALEINTVLHAV